MAAAGAEVQKAVEVFEKAVDVAVQKGEKAAVRPIGAAVTIDVEDSDAEEEEGIF